MTSPKIRVAVLMGGASKERNVSLSTGRQVLGSLDRALYDFYSIDTISGMEDSMAGASHFGGYSIPPFSYLTDLASAQTADQPDVVFIALHGRGGEDGTVQGMLEVLGIPYTGSGVLASALAMDKATCKRVLTSAGVRMPKDLVLYSEENLITNGIQQFGPPWIVKPNREGSTIGMARVLKLDQLVDAVKVAFQHDDKVLVEQFVEGTEITVPVLGNAKLEVLPIVEIVPSSGFYDYAAKYTPGATDEIVPARLSTSIAAEAKSIAQKCHKVLGCRGMSRTDMIVRPDGTIYTLEVNTIPGMTPTSLLPRSAEAAGISFSELLNRLIGYALER